MTVAPDARYTKTPAEVYQARLAGLQGRLNQLAEDVASWGKPSTDLATLRPDHVKAALLVERQVLRVVSQLGLDELVAQAVRADHPDANMMPGVLLDKAAAAIEAHVAAAGPDHPPIPAGSAAELAEVALRAVGLLR